MIRWKWSAIVSSYVVRSWQSSVSNMSMKSVTREPILQVKTSMGEPLTTRYGQVVPLIRVVKLRWPGGGLNWNLPAAVELQQEHLRQKLPIRNATRLTISTMALSALAITLGLSSFLKNRRRHRHD